MPLIDMHAQRVDDSWTISGAEDHGPLQSHGIYPLERLLAAGDHLPSPVGLQVHPGIDPASLIPVLDRVAVVAVAFPKFRDGRGFTIGRHLRERMGYRGEIRAIGHVLPDQFNFLRSCGFSTLLTTPEHPPEQYSGLTAQVGPAQQLLLRSLKRAADHVVTTAADKPHR